MSERSGRARAAFLMGLLLIGAGCVAPPGAWGPAPERSFRLGDLEGQGDPARRASNRLLAEGLDGDAQGRPSQALGLYERALQVDPTNPYAFLALARHHAEGVAPRRALSFLDKAEALLERETPVPPGVEAHLVGLRGAALHAAGRPELAAPMLERARRMAPDAWSDGRLSARELR